jgi:hypothetical protein
MTLNSRTSHPSARSYVLKLDRDAILQDGQIAGRLESMTSGCCFHFGTGQELLAWLARDSAASRGDSSNGKREP